MKTIIMIMKSIIKKAIVLTGFCSLFVLPVSADFFIPPDSPTKMSPVPAATQNTILNQGERKPFGGDDTPQSILRANPGGDGQKQVPADGGILVIIGLAIAYGIACRKFRKDTR